MIIVTFADKNYELFAYNLYKSFAIKQNFFEEDKFVFYGINYTPELKGKNLYNFKFNTFKEFPRFNFWKPRIILDVLDKFPEEENFCFIDADVLIGKRLDFNKLLENKSFNYPLSSHHWCTLPYGFMTYPDGTREDYTTNGLCEYFNIPVKVKVDGGIVEGNSCRYVQNCVILYNRKHFNFLKEWESMCEYEFLWKHNTIINYPYQDETVFNVLLWKYKATETLGFIHTNICDFEAYKKGEETLELKNQNLIDHHWSYVEDINNLMMYHGFKDPIESEKVINYINENLSS